MKRVAIIPARGGSKRIPRKNILPFHGKPMIAHSIDTAVRSYIFDEIWVSTEDVEIREIAERYGAEVHARPDSLADDVTGTQEVARDAVKAIWKGDIDPSGLVCCIYPTAPLMAPEDLRRGYRTMQERAVAFAFSIGTSPLRDAGQFYFGTVAAFMAREPLFADNSAMVPIANDRVCDINTFEDLERAKKMYEVLCQKAAAS